MIALLSSGPTPLPALVGTDAMLGLLRDLPGDIAFAAALGALIAVVVPLGGRPGLALWDRVIPYPADPGTEAAATGTDRRYDFSPDPLDTPADGPFPRSHPVLVDALPDPSPVAERRSEAA